MIYGALEVMSRAAAQTFIGNIDVCKGSHPDWQSWGEDAFLGLCLRQVGVGEIFLRERDSGCYNDDAAADCSDARVEMYHPYKDNAGWMQCWSQATVGDFM